MASKTVIRPIELSYFRILSRIDTCRKSELYLMIRGLIRKERNEENETVRYYTASIFTGKQLSPAVNMTHLWFSKRHVLFNTDNILKVSRAN